MLVVEESYDSRIWKDSNAVGDVSSPQSQNAVIGNNPFELQKELFVAEWHLGNLENDFGSFQRGDCSFGSLFSKITGQKLNQWSLSKDAVLKMKSLDLEHDEIIQSQRFLLKKS